jgi:hypothetical protein
VSQEPLERPRDAGALLKHALERYRGNFLAFLAIAAAIVVPAELIVSGVGLQQLTSGYDASPPREELIVPVLVSYLVTTPIITATCIHSLRSLQDGRGARPGKALSAGLEIFAPIFLAVALAAIGIVVGLALLILPGIYLAVRLFFVPQAVVVDGQLGPAALRRSWELVEGMWWRTFGIVVLVNLVATLPAFVVQAPVSALAKSADSQAVALLGQIAVETVVAPFVAIAATLLFYDLRARGASAPSAP